VIEEIKKRFFIILKNEQPMLFTFRSYTEPATKGAPDDELLWDRAMKSIS